MTSPSPPPFLACLACGRVTPLPPQLSTQAVLRCPHCHTQFALRDLLLSPAATWELVSESAQGDSTPLADGWPVEAVPAVGSLQADARSAAEELEADYTYVDPSVEIQAPTSPGAKTVEMLGHQTLDEIWPEEGSAEFSAEFSADDSEELVYEPAADMLFDSNRAANDSGVAHLLDENFHEQIEPTVEIPRRKLEGPLVGEFHDDPPRSERTKATFANSDWQSNSEETAQEHFDQPAGDQHDGEQPSYAHLSRDRRAGRKPRRSPIWSVLQIAMGGLAAIPISLLLMWHLLDTDVGDAAPWVAKYIPWIVPTKFHPYASNAATADTTYASPSNAAPSGSMPALPAAEAEIPATIPDEIPGEFPTVEPRALSEPESTLEAESDDLGVTEVPSSEAQQSTVEAESNNLPPDAPLTEEIAAEIVTAELEPTALESFFAMIRQAEKRLEEWPKAVSDRRDDATSKSQLAKLAHVTYGDLASLAMAIDELPSSNAVLRAVREQLDRIGQQVEQNLEVRHLIKLGSRFWVQHQLKGDPVAIKDDSHSQTGSEKTSENTSENVGAEAKVKDEAPVAADLAYGLAMTVVLDSAMQSADGQWWLANPTLDTQLGEPPLKIRIPRDLTFSLPVDALTKGQSLFLLGTVRPSPEEGVDDGTDEATQAKSFEASYLYPL